VNQAWFRTLGYTQGQLPRLKITDIIHPRSLSHWRSVCARVLAGESAQYLQATLLAQDGRSILVEGNMIGRHVDGTPVALHGFFRDMTERVRLQEQLIEREQLAALGRITGAIAHELGTPLNSALGYTQLLATADIPEDARRRLKIIESQVQRMAEIIKHYLSRTRGAPHTHRPINLNELVLETLVQLEIRFQQSHVQVMTEPVGIVAFAQGRRRLAAAGDDQSAQQRHRCHECWWHHHRDHTVDQISRRPAARRCRGSHRHRPGHPC
jgi:PAS domain S-box-containing protein